MPATLPEGFELEGASPQATAELPEGFELEDTSLLGKVKTLGAEFMGSVGSNLYKAGEGVARFVASKDQTPAEKFGAELADLQSQRDQVQADITAGKDVEENQDRLSNLDRTIADRSKDRDAMLASSYNQPEKNIARREEATKIADTLGDVAQTASTMYGQIPNDQSLPAQIGRGTGMVAALAPTMAIPGVGMVGGFGQMASSTYAEAFDAALQQQQEAGVTDQAAALKAAHDAAAAQVEHSIPQLAAYTVGGKLASGAVAKLLPQAAPIAKAAAGFGAAATANLVVSAATRVAEGQPLLPTAEQATQDILFGAIHGAGEYSAAKEAQVLKVAPKVEETIADTAEQVANLAQNSAPETAKAVAEIGAEQVQEIVKESTQEELDAEAAKATGTTETGAHTFENEPETAPEAVKTPEESFAPTQEPEAPTETLVQQENIETNPTPETPTAEATPKVTVEPAIEEQPSFSTAKDVSDYVGKQREQFSKTIQEQYGVDEKGARVITNGLYDDNASDSQYERAQKLIEKLGLTPEDIKRIDAHPLLSDASEEFLPNSRFPAGELEHETDPRVLSSTFMNGVRLGYDKPSKNEGHLTTIGALYRLKEVGATWSDIAKYIDDFTTRNAGNQSGKAHLFRDIADKVKKVAEDYNVQLPMGDLKSKGLMGLKDSEISQPKSKLLENETPVASEGPQGHEVGARVKLGKQITPFEIVEKLPQTESEKANNETSYTVKNVKTGETQTVEAGDITPIKGKAPKAKANEKPKPVAPNLPRSGEAKGEPARVNEKLLDRQSIDLRKRGEKDLGETHGNRINWKQLARYEAGGIKVTFKDNEHDSYARANSDGTIEVNLAPRDFSEKVSKEKAEAVHDEETGHVAQLLTFRHEWDKARQPGDFKSYIKGRARVLHDDLIASYNAAPEDEKPAIERMLVGAYNLYFRDFGEHTEAITNIGELIQKINEADLSGEKGQPNSTAYVMELTRMLHQERAKGRITESTFKRFLNDIKAWVKRAYEGFRQGVKNGVLDKTLAEKFTREFDKILRDESPTAKFIPKDFETPSTEKLDKFLKAKREDDILEGAKETVDRFSLTPDQAKLIEDNAPLAYKIANDYRNIRSSEYDDLKHEAVLAMTEAAKTFNPDKGMKFSSWAGKLISNRLNKLYAKQLRKSVREGTSLNEINPTTEQERIESVPAPKEPEKPDLSGVEKIREVVASLPDRERKILQLKADGLSLREISEELKDEYPLSHERINQIYKETAKELQRKLREEGITSRADIFPDTNERTQYLPERKAAPEDENEVFQKAIDEKLEGPTYTEERKFSDDEAEELNAAAKREEDLDLYSKPEEDFRNAIKGLKAGDAKRIPEAKERSAEQIEKYKTFAKEAYEAIPAAVKNAYSRAVHSPKFDSFKKVLLGWDGRRQQASLEVRRLMEEVNRVVPAKSDRAGIYNWLQAGGDKATLTAWRDGSKEAKLRKGYQDALDLTPDHVEVAKNIQKLLEQKFQQGLDAGVFKSTDSFRKNYVTQFWKLVDPDTSAGGSYGKLARNFKFARERKFNNSFEGEQAGFKPASKDISEILGVYINEMDKSIATREFIKKLLRTKASDGQPLAQVLGGMKTGGAVGEPNFVRPLQDNGEVNYKTLANNNLQNWKWLGKEGDKNVMIQGQVGLHPEIYDHVKNVLGKSAISEWYNSPSKTVMGSAIKGTAKLLDKGNRAFANSMLGGLSTFHQVHEAKRALGWRINPFKVGRIQPEDPKFQDAVNHGLSVAGDNHAMSNFKEGFGGDWNVWHTIPPLGKLVDTYTHYLFHEYIPALKLKTYNSVLERNMELYKPELTSGKLTPDDVKYISAKLTNDRYGHLNATDIGRNPTVRHLFRIGLLAPDFLESNIRNYGDAAKGVYSKAGREATYGFLTTAFVVSAAAKIINSLLDDKGDPHMEEPFGVVHNGKVYTMRNEAEDLFRAIFKTRSYVSGRLSPGIDSAVEALTGKNWRGEKVSNADLARDIATKWIPITARSIPAVSRLIDPEKTISAWDQFLSGQGLQVSRRSPINEVYKLAGEFKKAQGEKEDTGTYPSSPYIAMRYALEDGDIDKAQQELLKLADSTKKTPEKIYDGFKQSLLKPWTGSTASDLKFRKSLTGDDLATFENGDAKRKEVWKRFNTAFRQAAPEIARRRRTALQSPATASN